jgi:spermidine synthase
MRAALRTLHAERVVSAIFFTSGAASLVFEVVWFHRCALVFGNSLWSTSIVLSSFMGGLALGNAAVALCGHRIVRFLRTYALLEVTVAISGVALTVALPALSDLLVPLTRRVSDTPFLVNLVRLAVAFASLMVPATAMGATLPVLTAALCQFEPRFGRVLGRLYGWNTLGAVAGVIAAEVVLIETLGVMGSAWFAGALDVAAGVVGFRIARLVADRPAAPPVVSPPGCISRHAWRLLICGFLAGAVLMALEVVWFRFLSLFIIALTLPLSLMLAVVLAGIATGGLIGSHWFAQADPEGVMLAPLLALAAACTAEVSYATFRFVSSHVQVIEPLRIVGYAAWLTFPTAVLSGILFTRLGQMLRSEIDGNARTAGWMTFANTIGSMVGPLAATFGLLPFIGVERAMFVLVMAYVAIGLLAFGRPVQAPFGALAVKLLASGLAVVVVLVGFPFGLMSTSYAPHATGVYTMDGSTIIAAREGTRDSLFLIRGSVMGQPAYYRLATNNVSMSATTVVDKRYMRYFVYLPMLLHTAPLRHVLVACYGIGLTAGAATDIKAVESIDVVEISRDIVAMSDLVYAGTVHPLRDPRVRLHLEDARQFLQTSDQRFDLITGEPPPPPLPGTESLFSLEYFRLLRDHLADEGMVSYWLPVARRVGYDVSAVVRAFCDVFEDCSLWNGTPSNLILVGTRRATASMSAAHVANAWSDPVLWPHLREIGFELPEQVGATFMGDRTYLRELAGDAPPVTDDFPHRLLPPSHRYSLADPRSQETRVLDYYRAAIDPDRARRAFETSPLVRRLWPVALFTRTLPFFDQQRIVNRVLQDGAKPLRHIEELHYLLTETTLRRLPLWALGSNDTEQEIAQAGDDGTAQFSYLVGVRTLAARSYSVAAGYFAEGERRGLAAITGRPLLVYALCMSGSLDAARQSAAGAHPTDPNEVHFWQWLGSKFRVGPYAEASAPVQARIVRHPF